MDWDDEGKKKAIFRILGDNKGWALGVDHENRNYDYLSELLLQSINLFIWSLNLPILVGADIDHAHSEAAQDLLKWGEWIVKETGHVGFRFDAIKVSICMTIRDLDLITNPSAH